MIFVKCPHCNIMIEVIELNCKIFRCGIYKNGFQQIDPHMPKDACEELVKNDSIFDCGKPFMVIEKDKDKVDLESVIEYESIVCDYI